MSKYRFDRFTQKLKVVQIQFTQSVKILWLTTKVNEKESEKNYIYDYLNPRAYTEMILNDISFKV